MTTIFRLVLSLTRCFTPLKNMMPLVQRAITGFFIIYFSQLSFAQNSFVFNELISWNDLKKDASVLSDYIYFESEYMSQSLHSLPIFIDQKTLSQHESVLGYRITDEEVTSFPENLLSEGQKRGLSQSWDVSVKIKKGGDVSYLVVEVLPLRIQGGQIQRLTSFSLEVTTQPTSLQASRTLTFAENSALAEGTWYKIAIARDGIYKVDANTFSQLGVNISTLNPEQINIYGNGGELLPEPNDDFRNDDLVKNAVLMVDGGDGVFNTNDYILFYGKGPDKWVNPNPNADPAVWQHTKHYYSDSAYYFIRIDDELPLRINTQTEPSGPATYTCNQFQDYQYFENDLYNLARSGREFVGDAFEFNTNATYSFNFPNALPTQAQLDYVIYTRSYGGASNFTFTIEGQTSTSATSALSTGPGAALAAPGSGSILFSPSQSNLQVGVNFAKFNAEAQGWIDFIRLNVTRSLIMSGTQMKFRDRNTVSSGQISEFQLGTNNTSISIWDITNPFQPEIIPAVISNNVATWKATTTNLREYISFSNSSYLAPVPIGQVLNQNLHSLSNIDIVIISAPLHRSSADELASIHSEMGKSVLVVSPFEIYNEFSSGNPDPVAFRMLMKMLYDRANGNEDEAPENLILFGDGNYLNNKGLRSQLFYNVLVFESDNSYATLGSYVSDDYFVTLDDDDSGAATDKLDCGIGRIPAQDQSEASIYLSKVRSYLSSNTTTDGGASCVGDGTESTFGSWRNIITFVADDLDGSGGPFESFHLTSSENIAGYINQNFPEYDITKLYMDAFKQVSTPGGERYPEGEEAIRQRVQNGSLLVNYTGHGGEKGWAHERILTIPTISNWSNSNKLAVFVTATCELAKYDDPEFKSAGELLLLNPNGGAIAMLTTTRVVTSGSNAALNQAFFNVALDKENISNLTLGKINQLTKNGVSAGNTSKPNFSLIGDPALQIAYPQKYVYTTQINGSDVNVEIDTLKALQEVTFKGYVGDLQGVKLTDFNGFIYPTVYDKQSINMPQNNDQAEPEVFEMTSYKAYNNAIFKGKASVINGEFEFKFVVPYDINYTIDTARVSYYAVAGNIDAHGYSHKFKVGSSLSGAELNTVGPEIELYMNDSTFVSGGTTNVSPVLVAQLRDENGINTAGSGIGHDLIAYLDGQASNPIRLNEYYESDLDTYKSGQVRYQLINLEPGEHTLTFRAWDVHNNSSEKSIEFFVADNAGIALNHVLNYPNPFTTNTSFFFEHNQPCEFLDVRIQIYTIGGRLVKTINERVKQSGFRSDSITWDGRDDFGDQIGRGTYVYKLEVRNDQGQRAEKYEKLVILK